LPILKRGYEFTRRKRNLGLHINPECGKPPRWGGMAVTIYDDRA
jgi:hypothetical protein